MQDSGRCHLSYAMSGPGKMIFEVPAAQIFYGDPHSVLSLYGEAPKTSMAMENAHVPIGNTSTQT